MIQCANMFSMKSLLLTGHKYAFTTIHHIRTVCVCVFIYVVDQIVNLFFLNCSFCFLLKFIPLIEPTAEEWNLHRRLIQPTFHVNTLEQFLGTFIDASNVLVQRLKDGPSQLNITHLVNQCVIDILNGTVNQIISNFLYNEREQSPIC